MSNEADERERQRVLALAKEDLRKEIPALLADIHQESLSIPNWQTVAPTVRTIARFASLLAALYVKAEIQTRRVVRLTWAIVVLTAALLVFTIYLSQDAYFKNQRAHQERKNRTEISESDVNTHRPTVQP